MNKNKQFARRLAFLLGLAALLAIAMRGILPLKADELKTDTSSAPILLHQEDKLLIPVGSPLRNSLVMATIERHDIAVPFSLPASVEADPARLARILPPTTGRIISLRKHLGDEVKAGEILFEIASSDLAQAYSDERKALATLGLTQRSLERQRSLDQANISARRDLEQAQSDYEQAASEAARSRARLAALGVARKVTDVANAGDTNDIGRLAVRSPVSGHVIELNAAVGSYWNDTTAAVMTVADLSSVYVTANAQEKDLARLSIGQDADLVLDAYPTETLHAKVKMVGQLLDSDTRTTKVRIVTANSEQRLKPGMFAQVSLHDKPHPGLLVPLTAVVQSGFSNRVFVETAPWQLQARKVNLGAQVGDQVEVLSGLQAGARVVIKDGVLLND